VYDTNSVDVPVTCLEALESRIQFNHDVGVGIDA
jgi:hypothetical protein